MTQPLDSPFRLVIGAERERLDKVLTARLGLSRSTIQRLIDQGDVMVNDHPAKAGYKTSEGDVVQGNLTPLPPLTLEAQSIPLTIVAEDPDFIIVNKPPGLSVHPGPGHPTGTLVNALLARYPELRGIEDEQRPGIVHRLDKDTSGLMVVAKHPAAQEFISKQLQDHEVSKQYVALVEGNLAPDHGRITAPIGRDPSHRQRMAILDRGRYAETEYRVQEHFHGYTLLNVTIATGRTHQIRVHLSAIGHPVVGDALYGHRSPWCPRHFLHSQTLGFRRPSDNEYVEFRSELPEDLQRALGWVRAVK